MKSDVSPIIFGILWRIRISNSGPENGEDLPIFLKIAIWSGSSLHSNFQGVIITPLAGGVDIIPLSGFFLGGGRGRFFLTPKRSLKNSFSGLKMRS